MSTTSDHALNTSEPRRSKVSVPILGAGDRIGEGDTYLVENVLPPELAEVAFEKLFKEVAWNVMHHRGPLPLPHILTARRDSERLTRDVVNTGSEVPRLVAVQGEIDADGK